MNTQHGKIKPLNETEILTNYKPKSPIIQQIANLIDSHDNFLLTTHINSDSDGVGSQIGLYYLLKALKKKCVIINNELPSENFKKIVHETIVEDINQLDWDKTLKMIKGYFTFILDSSELHRSEKVALLFQEASCNWATIDHHLLPENPKFCIDTSYAATAEIIWDLYKYYKINIPHTAATALYVGIVADSGNFRYSKTSMRTHLAGGDLLAQGVESETIYRALYESHSFDRLLLVQRIYNKAVFNKKLGYAVGEIKQVTKKKLYLTKDSEDGIINQFLSVEGVKIAILLKQTDDNKLKCSFRSVGHIDVAHIAQKFGGGGHKNAAGCYIEEPYSKAKNKIILAIKQYLR